MRHNVDGRQFSRNTSHRVAMLKGLANEIIVKEQIVTTLPKAKEARRWVDRLITLAKKDSLHARRLAFDRTRNKEVVKKLFGTLTERYKDRKGGYTRVLKISELRRGDSAQMALVELVDHPPIDRKKKVKAAAEGAQEGADAASATTVDPFNRFRKLFAGKKSAGGGKSSASAAAQKGAARSTARPKKIGSS